MADATHAALQIKQIPKKVVGGLLGLGIPILRKAIKARAEFDISDLEPIAMAPKCSVPAIFIQGLTSLPQPLSSSAVLSLLTRAVVRVRVQVVTTR